MNNPGSQKNSVQQTRRRLFILLLRAYIIVMLVAVIFASVTTFYLVNTTSNSGKLGGMPQQSSVFDAYYIGHGSWEGVESLLYHHRPGPEESGSALNNFLLLDTSGRVLLDGYHESSDQTGELYRESAGEMVEPIFIDGVLVGMLVHEDDRPASPPNIYGPFLLILGLTTAFLAILTIVIGIFLTRRVVAPLAEVISASQSVTAGNLSSRVSVSGPDDLRALSDSFNRMAGSLERNDQERREMLADIAHELRTPLSVIRGRLEGVIDGIYPANNIHLMPVLGEIHLIERLIEDLHILTLAESRQLNFNYQPVRLDRLAKHVVSLFQSSAREKGVQLNMITRASLPPVWADLQRTEQVIVNLLGNALRYVPEGGQICVQVSANPGEVSLTVDDSGPGIPEEDLEHIFDRFWRSEKSRSRASGGTGLGLTIARQLIETQKGNIWASNRPEGGLQVRFVLPIQRDEHDLA